MTGLAVGLLLSHDAFMGWMDGAVTGMSSRLVSAGFTPDEAFSLAQAAYIKEKKRAKGAPSAVLKRSEASQVINQVLNLLGHYPSGAEAHRQRIILWEKVFGRGSWLEPFDPTEIYGPSANLSGSPSPDEDIAHDAAILNGALRYFNTVDLSFAGDRLMITATLFRGSGDDQRLWNGFVIIFDGMFGFFEESDCLAKNIEDGGPVVFQLSELRDCAIRAPDEFRWFGGEHVRFLEVSGNFYVTLSFTEGNKILRLFVPFEGLSPDLRVEAADSVRRMLHHFQKALELQADDSLPAATDRRAELLQGALRYIDEYEYPVEAVMLPAQVLWDNGARDDVFVVAKDGWIGLFKESDCTAEDIDDGDPELYRLMDLQGCTVWPHEKMQLPSNTWINFESPSNDLTVRMKFRLGGGSTSASFAVSFQGLSEQATAAQERSVRSLLELLEEGLRDYVIFGDETLS